MEHIPKLVEGLATLLWPIVALFVVVRFQPVLAELIQSAKSRRFTVKVAGNELTMEEVREQQSSLLAELQERLTAVERQLKATEVAHADGVNDIAPPPRKKTGAILWVDDNPRNNSLLAEMLMRKGKKVDVATSTDRGLELLSRCAYDVVITDMSRLEQGRYVEDAGLVLTRAIRSKNEDIPVVVFCSEAKAQKYHKEALAAGAKVITTSSVDLLGAVEQLS
ncbi:response regulator [Sorangium sp. So ce385]|uniref:response regulator n=1 Tax=Sorangium sp. So ce385 TaxID=3133308 RepID=UPI003F5B101B